MTRILSISWPLASRQLDAVIAPVAPDWPLNQISIIDRDILRMAVFELTEFAGAVPPKVAINEAVELAKSFGSENSSRFINGVLGTIWRHMNEGADEQSKQSKQDSPATTPEQGADQEPVTPAQ